MSTEEVTKEVTTPIEKYTSSDLQLCVSVEGLILDKDREEESANEEHRLFMTKDAGLSSSLIILADDPKEENSSYTTHQTHPLFALLFQAWEEKYSLTCRKDNQISLTNSHQSDYNSIKVDNTFEIPKQGYTLTASDLLKVLDERLSSHLLLVNISFAGCNQTSDKMADYYTTEPKKSSMSAVDLLPTVTLKKTKKEKLDVTKYASLFHTMFTLGEELNSSIQLGEANDGATIVKCVAQSNFILGRDEDFVRKSLNMICG